MTDDPFQLERFVRAQDEVYTTVLNELQAGAKRSHWMWFMFPQIDGLGHSPTAEYYAIKNIDEARAYLAHPQLGTRLLECTRSAIESGSPSASDLFGYPDDLKFCSSMTLFERIAPDEALFGEALDRLCDGRRDERTLTLLR